jgi:hypothetical protein
MSWAPASVWGEDIADALEAAGIATPEQAEAFIAAFIAKADLRTIEMDEEYAERRAAWPWWKRALMP